MSTKRILKTLAMMAVMLSVAALPAMAEAELDQSQAAVQAGTPVAWGDNNYGQSDVPGGLTGVVDMDASYGHSLALKSDGTVVAWGYNGHFQTDVPSGLTGVVAVDAGYYHSLALTQKPPDTTPPNDSSTSPSDNATGVSATAKISATFLEEGSGIDPSTLNTDAFKVVRVKPTGNEPIPGTLGYDESTQTVTFTPDGNLAKGLYRATITTGVEDKAGNALANDYTWRFATAGPPPR